MSKFGFLSVLEEELGKHLDYDFAMDWDKKNHAVEVVVAMEVQNRAGVETVDDQGQATDEDIIFEDVVLFYNPDKSAFDTDDYLTTIPYEPKKGLSREFLNYFARFLNDTMTEGLNGLMDFLEDDTADDFAINWDSEAFDKGRVELAETEFYGYPRY